MRLEEFLSQNAEVKIFAPGQIVFKQGTQADAAYYIVEGQVEIFQEIGGRPAIMADLGPGQIFGEMALLRFDEYTMSARAATETKLYLIAPEMLQAQLRATHPLIKSIVDMLVDRIHNVNEILIALDKANPR